MNLHKVLVIWAMLLLLPGNLLFAQFKKELQMAAKTLQAQRSIKASLSSAALQSSFSQATKKPDIRLSVARLDHVALLHQPFNKRPHTSAFVFETHYNGRREIWAATAGHAAQPHEKLLLTFYNGKKSIPVRAKLVQPGPALLSDVALIKLQEPLPDELKPFTLADPTTAQGPVSLWGYASNKLYHVQNLTLEKNNTRFIRTDFPAQQYRRSGLCGGPLLNEQGQVLGINCGFSLEDKAYASDVRILPYLLKAYHEGTASIPLLIEGKTLGNIQINERIVQIRCLNEHKRAINAYEVYGQLHQSDIARMLHNENIFFLQFVLLADNDGRSSFSLLTYDKEKDSFYKEPYKRFLR